jgi:hypothetical protein
LLGKLQSVLDKKEHLVQYFGMTPKWAKIDQKVKCKNEGKKVLRFSSVGKCDLIPRNKGPNEYFWGKFWKVKKMIEKGPKPIPVSNLLAATTLFWKCRSDG